MPVKISLIRIRARSIQVSSNTRVNRPKRLKHSSLRDSQFRVSIRTHPSLVPSSKDSLINLISSLRETQQVSSLPRAGVLPQIKNQRMALWLLLGKWRVSQLLWETRL